MGMAPSKTRSRVPWNSFRSVTARSVRDTDAVQSLVRIVGDSEVIQPAVPQTELSNSL